MTEVSHCLAVMPTDISRTSEGHHIHESLDPRCASRRHPEYLYHGNGMPMPDYFYSSWLLHPGALSRRQQQKEFKSLVNDPDKEYQLWDNHRWGNGLYWRYDVRCDGKTIGGGREKNAVPGINSYMYACDGHRADGKNHRLSGCSREV